MKQRKIRSRRPFDKDEFFGPKVREQLAIKRFVLHREFPDPVKRKAYIQALIKGLETEPILEN